MPRASFTLVLVVLTGAGLGCTSRAVPGRDAGAAVDARAGEDAAPLDATVREDARSGDGGPADASPPTDAPRIDAPPVCVLGATRDCYDGDPAHAGVGECAMGTETCVDGGEFGAEWGPCVGSGLPAMETCDGDDDDCDGMIDDGACAPGAGCPAQAVAWHLPAGTTGGPECIRTGGGTCEGTSDPSCADGESCWTRDPTCVAPDVHQATLRCDDGTYVNDCYCTVIATCNDGVLTATGFTW